MKYDLKKKDFDLIRFPNGEFKLVLLSDEKYWELFDLKKYNDITLKIYWHHTHKFANGENFKNPSEQVVGYVQLNEFIRTLNEKTNGDIPVEVYTGYVPYRRQDKRKLTGEFKMNNWDYHLDNLELKNFFRHDGVYEWKGCREYINSEGKIIVWPDTSAKSRMERYDFLMYGEIQFLKTRDAHTGELEFEPMTKEEEDKVKDKDCIIVDDIISKGGTFMHVAQELKNAGAKSIELVVMYSDGIYKKKDLKQAGIDKVTILSERIGKENE